MTPYQLALPNLTSVSTTVLSLVGAAFTFFLALKIFHAYAKKDWAAMTVEMIAGIITAFFVLMPDQAVNTLKSFASMIFGA